MKYLSKYLPEEYSWWMEKDNELIQLNEFTPTEENLRIIFYCNRKLNMKMEKKNFHHIMLMN